ncbi:phosphotransferase [Candidatus Vidania fulgoroideorum]
MSIFSYIKIKELKQLISIKYKKINLSTIKQGSNNSNYLVTLNNKKFVFTIFEKTNFNIIKIYFKILKLLFNNKIRIPRKNNFLRKKFFLKKPIILCDFIKNKNIININKYYCFKIGLSLFNIHKQSKSIFYLIFNNKIKKIKKYILFFKKKINIKKYFFIYKEYKFYNKNINLNISKGFCHCDLFIDNILFLNCKINGLIDFYSSGIESFLFDIFTIISCWCVNGKINFKKMKYFFLGYKNKFINNKNLCFYYLKFNTFFFWIERLFKRKLNILNPKKIEKKYYYFLKNSNKIKKILIKLL